MKLLVFTKRGSENRIMAPQSSPQAQKKPISIRTSQNTKVAAELNCHNEHSHIQCMHSTSTLRTIRQLVASLAMNCLAWNSTFATQVDSTRTLAEYMALRINADSTTEVHFEYFGGPIPGILAPIERPSPPYDATLREGGGWVPELFGCKVRPHKQSDEVDLRRYSGSVTVTLRTRATEGSPATVQKWPILFFTNRKEIWMDGKFWNIDDTFWQWMNRKFAFSGINIHLSPDQSSEADSKNQR